MKGFVFLLLPILNGLLGTSQCGYKGMKLSRFLHQQSRSGRSTGYPKVSNGQSDFIRNQPWQAAIVTTEKEHQCGGTIVSNYHVVTAAHCFFVENEERNTKEAIPRDQRLVAVSTTSPTEHGVYFNISQLHTHVSYGFARGGFSNDIAVVKIDGEFIWTLTVFPICLPNITEESNRGRSCIISGYGEDESGAVGLLKSGEVELQSDKECKENYGDNNITKGMFCAAGYSYDGKIIDTCKGDSGGPLYCLSRSSEAQYILLGVTSFGAKTCGQNRPGVYTKVTQYLFWIQSVISDDEFKPPSGNDSFTNRTWNDILPTDCGLNGTQLSRNRYRVRKIADGQLDRISSYPWLVTLVDENQSPICGGSIITSYHILTASSCFYDGSKRVVEKYKRRIHVGRLPSSKRRHWYTIGNIYLHGSYDPSKNIPQNDIALLKIRRQFAWSFFIFPICLPRQQTRADFPTCMISGYGSGDRLPGIFHAGEVVLINNQLCQRYVNGSQQIITGEMICSRKAGFRNVNICHRVTGGPLECFSKDDKRFLIGIISPGGNCRDSEYPTIYTAVNKYLEWIYDRLELSMGFKIPENLKPEVDHNERVPEKNLVHPEDAPKS